MNGKSVLTTEAMNTQLEWRRPRREPLRSRPGDLDTPAGNAVAAATRMEAVAELAHVVLDSVHALIPRTRFIPAENDPQSRCDSFIARRPADVKR
jgi:hypothetical protein